MIIHIKRPVHGFVSKTKQFNCNSLLRVGGLASCINRFNSSYEGETDKSKKAQEHPFHRAMRLFKGSLGDVKDLMDDPERRYSHKKIFPSYCDILVIGGGAIGSSAAYWLKQRALDGLRVVVVDRDPTVNISPNAQYKKCSTSLSVGGLRQQFSLKENIEMSTFGAHFLRNIDEYLGIVKEDPPEVFFNPHGYLNLASPAGAHILEENALLQASLGAKNELLLPERLKKKFPWINTEGIALGCHGIENEGWFDPWCLLQAFKNKAISLGVEYVDGEVVDFGTVTYDGVLPSDDGNTAEQMDLLKSVEVKCPDGVVRTINFAVVIVASGPQSGDVAKLAGIGVGKPKREIPLPVEPRKRYVYCFHCPDGPGLNTPLTIDPTNTYFRREGLCGNYICGRSPKKDEEPDASNLDVDDEYFNEKIWPVIAERVPAFENLKVTSSWAGYYDYNTYDQNVVIGQHPYCHNLYFCTGCSGHGIQQSPALGRAIMELIVNGKYSTIDLSRFGFQRLMNNEPMFERNII